jgi:hypothetical protein
MIPREMLSKPKNVEIVYDRKGQRRRPSRGTSFEASRGQTGSSIPMERIRLR